MRGRSRKEVISAFRELRSHLKAVAPWFFELEKAGLVQIEPHGEKKFVTRVNWDRYKVMFPKGNGRVSELLRFIEGRHPLKIVTSSSKRLKEAEKTVDLVKERAEAVKKLRNVLFLVKEGVLEVTGSGRVKVRREVIEKLEKSYLKGKVRKKYVDALKKLDGRPVEEVEILLREGSTRKALEVPILTRNRPIGDSYPFLGRVDMLPPRRYSLKDRPIEIKPLLVLYFLGKAYQEGLIGKDALLHIVENSDVEKLWETLRNHVTGIREYKNKGTVRDLLTILGEAIKQVKDLRDHDNVVAHATGRCPACGSPLTPTRDGLRCPSCGTTYKEPGRHVDYYTLDETPRGVKRLVPFQEKYPHYFPFLVLERGRSKYVVLNKNHPLVRALMEMDERKP